MAIAPDGRVFVAEKGGALRVVKNNALLSQPFLTVSVNSASERGLLGVAFDPDFQSNRFVYVYYTTAAAPIHNRVSRFTASSTNPDVAAGRQRTADPEPAQHWAREITTVAPFISETTASCTWPWARMPCPPMRSR